MPKNTSVNTLQDSAVLTGNGVGQRDGSDVSVKTPFVEDAELWVELEAIDADAEAKFFLETRVEGGPWGEAASVEFTEPMVSAGPPLPRSFPVGLSRAGGNALGDESRLRYEITGNLTAKAKLLVRE